MPCNFPLLIYSRQEKLMLRIKKIPSLDRLSNRTRPSASGATTDDITGVLSEAGVLGDVHLPTPDLLADSFAIVRDFADPVIELLRLLKEASEIEHSLMLQYLFAYFTIRQPKYAQLAGFGTAEDKTMLGVAIQEMQHLSYVNQFIISLDYRPNLRFQDLPYEPALYPFPMKLEPLSKYSAAKYLHAESPRALFTSQNPDDMVLVHDLQQTLEAGGSPQRPYHINQIGSLYGTILDVIDEVANRSPSLSSIVARWKPIILAIKDQGEEPHFRFFKSVFLGTHMAFHSQPNIWSLPESSGDYPSNTISSSMTAYDGHDNTIPGSTDRAIAWLTNLHYWIILIALNIDYTYLRRRNRVEFPDLGTLAKNHMRTTLLMLGQKLAARGVGAPFDQLSIEYDPGLASQTSMDFRHSLEFLGRLLDETIEKEAKLAPELGTSYPSFITVASKRAIERALTS